MRGRVKRLRARIRIRFLYRVAIARTLRRLAVAQEKLPNQGSASIAGSGRYWLITVRSATLLRQSTASQMIAVPSRLEERANWPSGEKATEVTSC